MTVFMLLGSIHQHNNLTSCFYIQRYTIRDLNTGQLYVLDGDEGAASPNDPASPASGLVTDVIQGRQLSLDEFEQVLGLNAVLEVGHTSFATTQS